MKLPIVFLAAVLSTFHPTAQVAADDCTNQHAACLMNYAPVCGSNGKTYGNDCMLEAAKCFETTLTKVSDGKCASVETASCEKACTREYIPVCGSDGKTYSNKCMFANAQCTNNSLQKASDGKCQITRNLRTECDSTMCLMNYAPVCGSDNKTYSNSCVFANAQCRDPSLMLVRTGAC